MKKALLIIVALVALTCAAAFILLRLPRGPNLRSGARRQWKENAIRKIARQSTNSVWLQSAIESLRTNTASDSEWDTWMSADLILMTNGDWMIYRNVCVKEPERIPDLFIGRGSNGRWYYSTYHFCIGMLVLKSMMEQPGSLSAFEKDCFLREFDGQSDDCLKSTWPKR